MKRFLFVAIWCALLGSTCGKSDTDGGLEGGGSSVACYLDTMFLCNEAPMATAAQQMNLPVACSSGSGVPSSPAACPTAGFQGKCTMSPASSGMDGVYVQRFYTGADVAYSMDYCVNTAHGTWSTTF